MAQPRHQGDLSVEGRIKWFDADRGFGFISSEGHDDFYFPSSEFQGATPAVGLAVEFDAGDGNRAQNVRVSEEPAVYSVTAFLQAMNATLATKYPEVTVEGEVGSVRSYKDSILFIELKEEGARVTCFIKKDLVPGIVEEGVRIRAIGTPNVATKNADVRLRARAIEFAGEGALKRAVELLRRRLDDEGLFASARKRSPPAYPLVIGLITSFGCDGDMDFRTKLAQRWPHATVHMANVPVQGAAAPDEIAAALGYFNEGGLSVDAIAIVRGGGNADDLQAFNTERVARAIVASRAPVITGVGHENDTTLADLAADVRAMTPTDAALRIAPDRQELDARLIETRRRLTEDMIARAQEVARSLLRQASQMERTFAAPRERLRSIESEISHAMEARLATTRERLDRHRDLVSDRQLRQLATLTTRLDTVVSLVDALAPQSVLRRGFAIVSDEGGVVRTSKKLRAQDGVKIRFDDGTVSATIEEV